MLRGGYMKPWNKGLTKEIMADWLLIVYDIPANSDGNKLRKQVLKDMSVMGAVMHTASCYYMPYSDKAFQLADELKQKGNAVVWVSQQKDKKVALQLKTSYEEHLKMRCTYIEQRLVIMAQHIEGGRLGKAKRMADKTTKLLKQLIGISETYNPEWLLPKVEELFGKLKELYSGT
jgi:hypothetical protein